MSRGGKKRNKAAVVRGMVAKPSAATRLQFSAARKGCLCAPGARTIITTFINSKQNTLILSLPVCCRLVLLRSGRVALAARHAGRRLQAFLAPAGTDGRVGDGNGALCVDSHRHARSLDVVAAHHVQLGLNDARQARLQSARELASVLTARHMSIMAESRSAGVMVVSLLTWQAQPPACLGIDRYGSVSGQSHL